MGFTMIAIGIIFLSNPVITVVDLVPDAIGFFLISYGLTKMSYFVGELSSAKKLYTYLLYLNLAKIVSILLLPGSLGSDKLLMTFLFSLCELLLFIPATNSLFEGIAYSGVRYGGTAMYLKKTKKKLGIVKDGKGKKLSAVEYQTEYLTSFKIFFVFFYVFRIAATLIPELPELQIYEYIGEVSNYAVNWQVFKPLFYSLFSIVTIVLGIVMIVKALKFAKAMNSDTEYIRRLREKYENDILPCTNFFTAKKMKTALLLLALSALTSIVLTIDSVNLMIGLIPSCFLIAAAVILRKYSRIATAVIPISAVRAVLSVVNFILQNKYFERFSETSIITADISVREEAAAEFYPLATLTSVENILALAAFVVFFVSLMRAIKLHLASFGIQNESVQYNKKNRDIEVYNGVGGKMILEVIVTVINFALAALYFYIRVYLSSIIAINAVITIVFAAYTVYLVNFIGESVYDNEISHIEIK